MHRRWQYGVAKSQRAARRQVQTGHYRPRVSRSGYRANSNLDADNWNRTRKSMRHDQHKAKVQQSY